MRSLRPKKIMASTNKTPNIMSSLVPEATESKDMKNSTEQRSSSSPVQACDSSSNTDSEVSGHAAALVASS